MTNLIKYIVTTGNRGIQTVKQTVRSNERGPKGDQGEQGIAATIAAGDAYSVPTTQAPSVQNRGTSTDAVFDFYIPKGETGNDGEAATVTVVETQTLPTGEHAFVRNAGDEHEALLHFGIPAGAQGAQGEQGEKGDQGLPGLDGAIQYHAGVGISIDANNTISATGEALATWGSIQGSIADQTDLQAALSNTSAGAVSSAVATSEAYTDTQLEGYKKTEDLPTIGAGTLTVTNNGTSAGTFGANQTTDATIALAYPVITVTDTDPGEGAPLEANHFIFVY